MFGRIFPKQYDNTYRGWRLAIWLLALVVLLRLAQGVSIVFNPLLAITTADGIPVSTYAAPAAATVVLLFALLGLSLVLVGLVGLVALIRYRAMIPLVYLLLLIQALGSRAIVMAHPIVRAGATMVGPLPYGTMINLITYAVLILGLVLSLLNAKSHKE